MKVKTLVFIVTMFFLAACGDQEAEERRVVPIQFAEAKVQRDHSTLLNLIIEPNELLQGDQEAENDYTINNYELIEWKYEDDIYFYEMTYYDERRQQSTSEKMEIQRTDEGWKKTIYGDSRKFDEVVPTLGEGEVLREMSE